jgi:sigma-B regulation protein RsbU (phosphoserine phosphatase)
VPPGSSLFVYSDGAFEISLPEGGMWPFDAFVETLAEASAGRRDQPAGAAGPLDVLLGRVRDLAGRADFHDDFSMLELVLG